MKSIKIVIIVLIVAIVLPLVGFTFWIFKASHPANIVVINKSMRDYRGSENQALNYLLNKEKIFTSWDQKYDLSADYYGLHWLGDDYRIRYIKLKDVDEEAVAVDLVYYADAYGIRTSDLRILNDGEKNQLEYGGVNNTDYSFIKSLLSHDKSTVIESSFFGPPTDPLVRYNLETLTDIYFVGWNGKYLADLAIDPDCNSELNCKKLYEDYTGEKWTASGPGMVFYNTESGRIFVLEEGKDINTTDGLIHTDQSGIDLFNLPEKINYNGKFSVLHPGRNKVLSFFELNPTDEGMQKLNEGGIPERFPALIQADNHFYCMAGDFGKNRVNMTFSRIAVINDLLFNLKKGRTDASGFYCAYYYPFMKTVIDQAYSEDESE